MAWRTIGNVTWNGYLRRVAWDSATGEVERTFGDAKHLTDVATSRYVGKAHSRREALDLALEDLKITFR